MAVDWRRRHDPPVPPDRGTTPRLDPGLHGSTRADPRDDGCMNETCDRCGPTVRAVVRVVHHAERTGELYLCRHCGSRLWAALNARGWTTLPVGEHAFASQVT